MQKISIKREQSQAGLSFAEREKFRPQVKNKLLLLLGLLMTAATSVWADEWTDIIINGSLEGSDTRCFFVREDALDSGKEYYARIQDGIGKIGSRAIVVQSTGTETNPWDTQFYIRLPYDLPANTEYRLIFDYKADNAGDCVLQIHNEPNEYVYFDIGGTSSISFGTDWKHYDSGDIFVPTQCDGTETTQGDRNYNKTFRTIAFNLANNGKATRYIIDNIKVEVPIDAIEGKTPTTTTKEIPLYPTHTLTLGTPDATMGSLDFNGLYPGVIDDCEAYTVGGKVASSAVAAGKDCWTTWSGTPGSGEDGTVVSLDNNKCCGISESSDLVYQFGDKTTGVWEYAFDMYVPKNNIGYFNLLHDFAGSNSVWAMQCYFNGTNDGLGYATYAPGHGTLHAGSNGTADLPCTLDEWMNIRVVVDIDNDIAEFYFNGSKVCEWQWSLDSFGENVVGTKLDASDFYFVGGEFYIDNISFRQLPKAEGVTDNGDGTYSVVPNTHVTLKATAAEGYHVAGWYVGADAITTGDGIAYADYADTDWQLLPATSTYTFNMGEPVTIEPIFAENKFDLTLSPVPVDKVTVTVDGAAVTPDVKGKVEGVDAGKEVKITAKPSYKLKKVQAKKTVPPTLAETLTTAGMTVTVNFKYSGDNYCTFTSVGDGTYTFTNGSGWAGGTGDCEKALVYENGQLVFKQAYDTSLDSDWNIYGYSVFFDTSDNTYSEFLGDRAQSEYVQASFISISVNGTTIPVTVVK